MINNKNKFYRLGFLILATLVILMPFSAKADDSYNAITTRLANGLDVVMIENHSASLVSVFVSIKAGSATENYSENGVTHLLEHMLFNGTTKRTQQELYDEMDLIGGYNNAYTRDDFTAFIITIPSKDIEKGMDMQSDMLFNSTFIDEKVTKELGIVSEEIRRDTGSPQYAVNANFDAFAFAGTPYTKTTLGTVEGINKMTPEVIKSYWQKWYVPNNMSMIVVGDFVPSEMLELINKYYGKAQPGNLPKDDGAVLPGITQKVTKIDYLPSIDGSVRIVMNAPAPIDKDGLPFQILVDLMTKEINEDLKTKNPGNPIKVSLEIRNFKIGSRLIIGASVPPGYTDETVIKTIMTALRAAKKNKTLSKKLANVKIASIAYQMKLSENMMYFGMFTLGDVTLWGWDYVANYTDNIDKISVIAIDSLRQKYFSSKYQIYISKPFPKSSAKVVSTKTKLTRKTLPNGLEVLVKQSDATEIFGMHILFKNRCYLEPEGKDGIVDLLHKTFAKGTGEMSETDISDKITSLGIDIKTNDFGFIPYDDYYLDPEYSYFRLTGLDRFWNENLDLISDLVMNDGLTQEILDSSRTGAVRGMGQSKAKASSVARKLFKSKMVGESPRTRSITGNSQTLGSITLDEMKDFRAKYVSPDNMIITIVSSVESSKIMQVIENTFGTMKPAGTKVNVPETKYSGYPGEEFLTEVGGPQSYIIFAFPVESFPKEDRTALQVLGSIISKEIAFELRERQGLAYSVGASFALDDDTGYFSMAMGTGPENIEKAKKGIRNVLKKFKSYKITQKDRDLTVNSRTARMIRYRITRTNQAYYIGYNLFEGKQPEYTPVDEWYAVTVDDLIRVRKKYFTPEDGFFVIAK